MTEKGTDDAVGHFSASVKQFHAYYQERAEFRERLDLWCELLDKHSVPGGLSIDMGCGTGVFSFDLAQKGGSVVGVDANGALLLDRGGRRLRFVSGEVSLRRPRR